MRRRKFLMLLGGAVVACPLAARAQQPSRRPTVAFLFINASAGGPLSAAFSERLRALGWTEGRNVAIEYHWSEGRPERVAEIAAELVQEKVNVIVTYGAAAATLKQATTSIPIVVSRERSGRQRPRRKPFASGRQRHGIVAPDPRKCW